MLIISKQKVLREEVKDQMKWNVDRSSSSTKIRELMEWSKDIIEDIYYQKRIRKNKLWDFLIRHWAFWNNACILLSLAINIIMVISWEAKGSLGKTPIPENATHLPDSIHE